MGAMSTHTVLLPRASGKAARAATHTCTTFAGRPVAAVRCNNAAGRALALHCHASGGVSRRDVLRILPASVLLSSLPASLDLLGASPAAAGGPVLPPPAVQAALDKALAKVVTKAKSAVALRLVFHDAATYSAASKDGGFNASIQYELDRPENFGLKRGWRLVEQVRDGLRGSPAEGKVTDADLVAFVGAYGVRVCGGPSIPLPTGRPTAQAARPDPPGRMPGENFTADELKANFAAKGFSVQELVALSGAHTLGSKGFGDPVIFDNEYYKALLKKPWLNPNDSMASMIGLPSDHVLPDDADCLPYIKQYAADQAKFFEDFSDAYIKMTSLGVAWL